MRRAIIILLLAAVAGGGGLAWHFLKARWAAEAERHVLYGNIDIRQVDLGFRVSGRLKEMRFEEGDAVKAGEVIAVLDKVPFQDDLKMAEAQRNVEAANLAKVTRGNRPQEIDQARALVVQREAAYQNAQRILKRQQELFSSGYIARQTLDDALSTHDQAEAELRSARQGYDLARQGFRVEDIDAARASVAADEARIAQARTNLSDTDLVAPADGVILTRVREPGAIVPAGNIVYTLSLNAPVWARAYVPEPMLGLVHPGMDVLVYTDSAPNRPYHGQVGFISPTAEFTPKSVETKELRTDLVYRLRVIISDPDPGLRQGMPVTVDIAPSGAAGKRPPRG